METHPFGRTGLLVEVDDLDQVLGLYAAVERRRAEGGFQAVQDVVPAARTVLLRLDPRRTTVSAVEREVRDLRPDSSARGDSGTLVEIPVAYDGEDLDEVSAVTGWSAEEIVNRHTAEMWTVAFCGFAPGFGYLVSDSGDWSVPRRTTPRSRVPAGSVALAGEFSAVYPRDSPGGWQLIGRTPLEMFDLNREPPALLVPGARVRFVRESSGTW